MLSQNVLFVGPILEDREFDHPPGLTLVRQLTADLAARRWKVGDFDNWRDAGWEILCSRGDSVLVLIFSAAGKDDEWMAQISAYRTPGLVGRLLGRTASATPADMFALAQDLHELLTSKGFERFRWVWDDMPSDDSPAVPSPP